MSETLAVRMRSWYQRWPNLVDGGAIVLLVVLLYAHTLQVPFYLDDTRGLLENYRLRDLALTFRQLFEQRGLTSLTFALNYRLSGWALPPLHLTNILLHAACGLLVWRILSRLLTGRALPLLGGLLFVAHPLQTQGVTYLIQRATTLAACGFLLAFLLYLRAQRARQAGAGHRDPVWLFPYLGAILAGSAAVLAKEHTAMLPVVLLAYRWFFPGSRREPWRQILLELAPFCLVPLFLGTGIVLSLVTGEGTRTFVYPITSLQHNSPLHYLVTQFSVVWIYLRLLFLPYGQALEHNYPVVAELVTLSSGVALTGLLLLAWLVWRIRRRQPLVAFGAVWFGLTLLIESSIIPLDPLFEHRLYLPLFGVLLALLAGLPTWLDARRSQLLLVLLLLAWMPLTWQRNALWRDPLAFYEDNVRRVPDSERAVKALALAYAQAGRHAMRWQVLATTVERFPDSYFLYGDLARLMARQGNPSAALELLEKGMAAVPAHTALYEAAAEICKEANEMQLAIAYLQRGVAVENSDRGRLLNALGVYYSDAGDARAAEEALRSALAVPAAPSDRARAYMNLAREYYYQERWSEVFATLRTVLELSPGEPEALQRLGEMSLRLGERDTAEWVAEQLRMVDPPSAQRFEQALRAAGQGRLP